MRWNRLLILLIFLFPSTSSAAKTSGKMEQALARSGLLTKDCLHYVDNKSLNTQKKRWSALLESSDKEEVMGWLSGQKRPPKAVLKLVKKQYRCMFKHMVSDATQKESKLNLENKRKQPGQKRREKFAKRATTKKGIAQFERKIVRSFYRKSVVQAGIWKRKFRFKGRSFNIISEKSGKKCKLKTGSTWKPKLGAHRRCWKSMTGEEREQEILLASSAPGISRHHWGSDVDIFGLNPRTFVAGKKNFDEYLWLKEKAHEFGFFQPYSDRRKSGRIGYMNERWHWSYYPLAEALRDYAEEHHEEFENVLFEQWDKMEGRKKKKTPYFSFIRTHWRDFVFNVANLPEQSDNLLQNRENKNIVVPKATSPKQEYK